MTNKTLRRTLLVGASILPVASLPALASDNPDAELLRLGAELEPIIRERDAALCWPKEAEEEFDWCELMERLEPLANEIISRKAQTVAGLAVQARAMAVYAFHHDDEADDTYQAFIGAVCAFAGAKPLAA